MPYSPHPSLWTEEQYHLYSLIELSLGNRKEITKEEAEEIDLAARVEEAMLRGDRSWQELIDNYFDSGGDLEDLPVEDLMEQYASEEEQ